MNGFSKIKDPLISHRGTEMLCYSPDLFRSCDSKHTQLNGFAEVRSLLFPVKLLLGIRSALLA